MDKKLLGILSFVIAGNISEGFSVKVVEKDSSSQSSFLGGKKSYAQPILAKKNSGKIPNSLVMSAVSPSDKYSISNSKVANVKLQDWITRLSIYADIFKPTITQTRFASKKNYNDMVSDVKLMLDSLSSNEIVSVLKTLEQQSKTKDLFSIIVNPLILFNIDTSKVDSVISNYLVKSLQMLLESAPNARITFVINTLEEYLMNQKFLSSLMEDPLVYNNFSRFVNVTIKKYVGSDSVASLQYWELLQKINKQKDMNLASAKSKTETQKANSLRESQKRYQEDLDGLAFGRDGNYDDPITNSQRNKKDSDELPFANQGSYNDLTEKEKYDRDLDGLAFGRDGNYDDPITDFQRNKKDSDDFLGAEGYYGSNIGSSKNNRSSYVDPLADKFVPQGNDITNDDYKSKSVKGGKEPISFIRKIGNKMQDCRCICGDKSEKIE